MLNSARVFYDQKVSFLITNIHMSIQVRLGKNCLEAKVNLAKLAHRHLAPRAADTLTVKQQVVMVTDNHHQTHKL